VLAGIVAAACAIRLLHAAALHDTAFPRFPLVYAESDMHAFWEWAQRIQSGDWLGRDTYHPAFAWMRDVAPLATWHRWWGGEQIFHQAPLYPYFVATLIGVTGATTPEPVLVVQLLLGALQPIVLFALGRRLADERVGLVAAALSAAYAPLVFHEGVLLRDWLPPLLEPLALVLLLRAAERGRARDWALAGASLGAALLARETALLLVPAVALWLATRRASVRSTAAAAVCLALGFAAALAPLVARNAAVGAPLLALSNRGGVTFAQHNAAPSSALWSEYDPALQRQILVQADGDGRAVVRATLATYGGDTGALLRKLATKLRGAADPIEIPSNVSFAYGRELSWMLRALPGYGLVFPLGVAGILLAARGGRRPALLLLYVAISLATLAVSLPLARYRLPLATALMPFAGLAVIALADAARARRALRCAAIATAIGVAAVAQQWILAVPELRTSSWMALYGAGVEHRTAAAVYAADGRPDRAADELRRLRERAPDDPWSTEIARGARRAELELRAESAARLIGTRRPAEARAELARAEALAGEEAHGEALLARLGGLYEQLGDADKAQALRARSADAAAKVSEPGSAEPPAVSAAPRP